MKPCDVLLLGCGDIGTAIARQLLSDGRGALAVRRNTDALPPDIPSQSIDYTDVGALSVLAQHPAETAILTPTPPGRDPDSYRRGYLDPVKNLLSVWQDAPPKTLFYVSSTRVYGDQSGGWVDEKTPVAPADPQGEILCRAEELLLESHHRVAVIRFSGIYGRWPSRLIERIRGGDIVRRSPPHFSNRIHRSDCVGFLLHLLHLLHLLESPTQGPGRLPLYLASDDEPALSYEVESWLAQRLGVQQPRETVDPPPANRRCRNTRMKATGYRLQYPDFRAGYSAMISSTSMSAPFGSAAT
jgi:nucleoside-diphosphate-sugar epimerase